MFAVCDKNFLFNRRDTLILGILGTLGILGICRRTQTVTQNQMGCFSLLGSPISGIYASLQPACPGWVQYP